MYFSISFDLNRKKSRHRSSINSLKEKFEYEWLKKKFWSVLSWLFEFWWKVTVVIILKRK